MRIIAYTYEHEFYVCCECYETKWRKSSFKLKQVRAYEDIYDPYCDTCIEPIGPFQSLKHIEMAYS